MIVTQPVDVPGPARRQAGVARGPGISYASALRHHAAGQNEVAPAPRAVDPLPLSHAEAIKPQSRKQQRKQQREQQQQQQREQQQQQQREQQQQKQQQQQQQREQQQQKQQQQQQQRQAAPQWPLLGKHSQESAQASSQAAPQAAPQAVGPQAGKKQAANAWGLFGAPRKESQPSPLSQPPQTQPPQSQPPQSQPPQSQPPQSQPPQSQPPQSQPPQSQPPQSQPPQSQPSHRNADQTSDHEFDFDDVFGPSPASSGRLSSSSSLDSSHDASSGRLATASGRNLRTVDEIDEDDLAAWMAGEQLPELAAGIAADEAPEVITHRSHSLVGPAAVTPRQSVARSGSRRSSLDEPDSARAALMGSSPSLRQSSLESPRKIAARAMLRAAAGEQAEAGDGREGPAAAAVADVGTEGGRESNARGAGEAETTGDAAEKAEGKMGPEDFELLRVVGQGAFGKVFQVQQRWTGEILAMKVMRKERILERQQGDYMQAERDILTKVEHPFIVHLHYSFQTSAKLYLILDFINGGHLFFQLYRHGTFSEELARLYTAELVLAVGHLHSLGIMHRDLKPENILLDSDGHIKLTDFGLAKEVRESDRSNSLCGTMEYMAPEIIQANGHGFPADWWSIGILLFEMLTGQPPFSGGNRQKLQQRIVKEKVKLPTYLTSEAHSLLRGLLQKDPAKRLGSGPLGAQEIRSHKWFKGVCWRRLEAREVAPLFRPLVTNGKRCTANFDEMWTKMPVHDSPAGTPTMGGADVFFRNYSYVAPPAALSTVDSDSDGEAGSGGSEGEEGEGEEGENGVEGDKGEEGETGQKEVA